MQRTFVFAFATAAWLSIAPVAQEQQGSLPEPAPTVLEPSIVMARLKAGNDKFVARASQPLPIDESKRKAQVAGQKPMAMVLSCADSRVPPEVVFNVGLGELFVVRVAGEVVDHAVLASIEYAAEHLGPTLLVVMGHESCSAVRAAIETPPAADVKSEHLTYLLQQIRPAFERLREEATVAELRDAILANVEQSVNDVMNKSEVVRARHGQGRLGVVGAYYELSSGRVHFSTPVPRPGAPRPTTQR